MKKRNFSFFLVVSSAVLTLSLLFIQYYWLRNAIIAYHTTFDKSVQESINKVIYNLEKKELAEKLKHRYSKDRKGTRLFHTIDSINALLFREFQTMFKDSIITDSIINITKERIQVEIITNKYGQAIARVDTSYVIYSKEPRLKQKQLEKTSVDAGQYIILPGHVDSLMYEFDKFLKRTFIASDVLQDILDFSSLLPIEERINFEELENAIRQELSSRNIKIPIEIGIYDSIKKTFIYETTGKYSRKLLSEGMMFQLFPSDFFSVPNYLYVFFPSKRAFVIRELRTTLFTSAFLIILIMTIFFYILISFLRQKKLTEERNEFVSNMTHELKTPIASISLAVQALNDPDIIKNDKLRNFYLNVIQKDSSRLHNMVEKVLQTTLIENKEIALNKEETELNELVKQSIKNIQLQLEQKNAEIHTFFLAQNHKVYVDKMHMSNVIYNLLDNAIKYTNGKPVIMIKTYNSGEDVVLEVIDNGIGIAKSEQKKIFEKLYRVPSGNVHNVKGFGLGLSYVQKIIQMHDGNISVESEPGKGSTFRIRLKNKIHSHE